jgi:hypothetical protein
MEWLSKKFFIRLFLFLIVTTVVMRLWGFAHISDTLVGMMMGHCIGLIGLNAWEKTRK